MVAVIRRVVQGARGWLTAPEPRIAGRMGLFRMIYAVFYLWHLSWVDGATLGLLPDAVWQPVYLLRVVPLRPPERTAGHARIVPGCGPPFTARGLVGATGHTGGAVVWNAARGLPQQLW